MPQHKAAKFALTALAVCANAHCGGEKLTAERLAELLRGKTRAEKDEKRALRQILENADPKLLAKARQEALDLAELVVVPESSAKTVKTKTRREKAPV